MDIVGTEELVCSSNKDYVVLDLATYDALRDIANKYLSMVDKLACAFNPVDYEPTAWHQLNFDFSDDFNNNFEFPAEIVKPMLRGVIDKITANDAWMQSCIDNQISWASYDTSTGVSFSAFRPSEEYAIFLLKDKVYLSAYERVTGHKYNGRN